MYSIYRDVGRRLRARRQRQGITLEALAELSSVHPSYIGQIERGTKKFSLRTLGALSLALETTVGQMVSDKAGPKSACRCGSLCAELSDILPAERRVVIVGAVRLAKALRTLRR